MLQQCMQPLVPTIIFFHVFFPDEAFGSNCCRVGMNGSHAALYLDRFFRRTCPLLVILGLFVLFAARRQVGVVGQTAEQRGDHWTGIHLLLQHTHTETETHSHIRVGDLLVIWNCLHQLRGLFKIRSLIAQFQHFWLCHTSQEWFYIHIPSMFLKKTVLTSNRAIFLPSYCWLFSASLAALLLMKGLLSLGFPSPETRKHRAADLDPSCLHSHICTQTSCNQPHRLKVDTFIHCNSGNGSNLPFFRVAPRRDFPQVTAEE